MDNSVVVVTGGSGGIGQALVKKYLQEGCFVISADLEKTTDFEDRNLSFLQCNVECEKSIKGISWRRLRRNALCCSKNSLTRTRSSRTTTWTTTWNYPQLEKQLPSAMKLYAE